MRIIAHSYDTYDQAVRVVDALEAAGVPHQDISLVSGDKNRAASSTGAGDSPAGAGTGATVGTVLGGGAGLLAGLGALAIPGVGPVVAAGWLIATLTGAGIGAATGGLIGSLTAAGLDEADAKGYAEHVGRGGTLVTVRADDQKASRVESILHRGAASASQGSSGLSAPATSPVPQPGDAATGPRAGGLSGADDAIQDDTIQVVKENLVVGKRRVESGAVRITSHVAETPVEEQVTLHEERVVVDRRPVNRPWTGSVADDFRERTLSMAARSEEAVVGKEVRVVEEIELHKVATDRVETVHDRVRETQVDVETVPAASVTASDTSGPTTPTTTHPGSLRYNAATRAVDETLNTNLSGENSTRKA